MTRSPLTPRRRGQGGYTLVEIMVSLGVATILMSGITAGVQYYFAHFHRQVDKATARQTGRVVVDLLRQSALRSGWGFNPDIAADGAQYLGVCFDDSNSPKRGTDCNNLSSDGGSDRLTVFYGNSTKFQGAVRETATTGSVPVVLEQSNVDDPFDDDLVDELVFVSGTCVGTEVTSHVLGERTTDGGLWVGQNGTYRHSFGYSPLPSSGSLNECSSGRTNFNFGLLHVAEFRIDRTTEPDHPTLLMRTDPRVSWEVTNPEVMIVGRDVDDLQILYGVDTGVASMVDGIPDVWCSEPATLSGEEGCNTGLTAAENLNRIVALQIAVVVRTAKYRTVLDLLSAPTMQIFDHTIVDTTDGYRRWMFRTTVALRNNSI